MKFDFPIPAQKSLPHFLKQKMPFLRLSLRQKLWRKQEIKFNGQIVKPEFRSSKPGLLTIFLPNPRQNFFTLTGSQVLHEDQNLIVFNKKAGQPTHAGAGTQGRDLKNAAEVLLKCQLRTVHRLDCATSGVLIFAKNFQSARQLEEEFRQQRVQKKYLAVVSPSPPKNQGQINFPLQKKGLKIVVQNSGQSACTNFRVLQKLPTKALLEVQPLTGRTHQIRVHLQALGCPVLGDELYQGRQNSRLLLHAAELSILGQKFNAPIPKEFQLEKIEEPKLNS